MELNYKKAESALCPPELDEKSSPAGVYLRRNIEVVEYADNEGVEQIKYVYEEAFITHAEYEHLKLVDSVARAVQLRHETEIKDECILELIEGGIL